MDFYDIYAPLTATPFARSNTYMEWEPCTQLKPYVKCFWGSRQPYRQYKSDVPMRGLVTPDTCVDIIFTIDHSGGHIFSHFCGIDTETFSTYECVNEDRMVSTFAIRFYAWSAVFFAEDSLRDTVNGTFALDHHFARLRREIEPLLYDVSGLAGRIRLAERYGYTDQAHLARDFKRFHSMNISEARRYAAAHVANLQDPVEGGMVSYV